jgi:glyoxylase-like metal-dependent hydrolase (beta-lactamase superfamily II)
MIQRTQEVFGRTLRKKRLIWAGTGSNWSLPPLFDQLVGGREKRFRHLNAEQPSGLQVYYELELGRPTLILCPTSLCPSPRAIHKHLLVAERVEDWDFTFPSSPLPAIPTETFSSEKILKLNRFTVHLKYYGPAHTDSDISVAIPEADVFHCADTYWNGFYPFIDYLTGGNIDGMIKAAEANVAAVTDNTVVIPGHGNPVSNKAELSAYRDMLVAIRDNVAKLKQQGRSLQETIAAKPTAAFDAKWGQFVITPALFTRLVYQGVSCHSHHRLIFQ